MSELQSLRKEFWEALSSEIGQRETPLDARKPTGDYYYVNGIGNSDWKLAFLAKTSPSTEISCHLITDDDEETYSELYNERRAIHDELGEQLVWLFPGNADTTRYRAYIRQSWDVHEKDRWGEYIDWLLDTGEQFDAVFRPRLSN